MKINNPIHYLLRQLTLVSALFVPVIAAIAMTPANAVELVGKPVPVQSAAAKESVEESRAQSSELSSELSSVSSQPHNAAQQAVPEDWEGEFPPPPVAPPAPLPDGADVHGHDPARHNGPHNAPDRHDLDHRIQQALEQMEHREMSRMESGAHVSQLFSPDIIIPLFAITFIFGGPFILLVVFAVLHFRAKAKRQKNMNDNIERLLAAGRDIPIELLRGDEPLVPVNDDNLRKGIHYLGLGIGLLIFLTILLGIELGSVAFILIGLGVSRLIIWKLSDTKTEPLDVIGKAQD